MRNRFRPRNTFQLHGNATWSINTKALENTEIPCLPDWMTLVMYSETNTDPKGWFVRERGDLITGLWSLFFTKKEIMDNILSKMTPNLLYEVFSCTYKHTHNETQKWKIENQKGSWLESRKKLHRVETQNDVHSPSPTPDSSLGEPRQKTVAGS